MTMNLPTQATVPNAAQATSVSPLVPSGSSKTKLRKGKTRSKTDVYYGIRARKDGQTGGIVELVDDSGQVQLFSAFESSLRDVAIFTSRQIAVSVGEYVTFSRSDREQGRNAGENWRVSAVAETGEIHLTRGDVTRILKPGQEMADRHLDYGYAGTTHKAQGASARYVIVLAGAEGARASLATLRETYVALSRAKEHIQIYTDNLARWLERVSGSSDRPTAHDILLSEKERMTGLARRLWKEAKPLKKMACDPLIQHLPGVCREARVIPAGKKISLSPYRLAGVWSRRKTGGNYALSGRT